MVKVDVKVDPSPAWINIGVDWVPGDPAAFRAAHAAGFAAFDAYVKANSPLQLGATDMMALFNSVTKTFAL